MMASFVERTKNMLEEFVDHLKKTFEIRILPAGRFIGIDIKRNRNKRYLSISQRGTIDDILNKLKLENCNSVTTRVVNR